MNDFRIGYLYSLAPIHCGGEGNLGNILEIAREAHTNFPYIPGSSLRGSLRDEVEVQDEDAANILFGKELDNEGQMGVHQVWFGDARLLWVPMRTMSLSGSRDVFTWVSCHSLIRDSALIRRTTTPSFPNHPVGTQAGTFMVADAQVTVSKMDEPQKQAIALSTWPSSLEGAVRSVWEQNCIVLPDADFQVLMEHALWTQVRNKIQDNDNDKNQAGSAEVFWTDVCIPRDTILYFSWGYSPLKNKPLTQQHHSLLMETVQGLIQVGGQANVGRGWVQSWVGNSTPPIHLTGSKKSEETAVEV